MSYKSSYFGYPIEQVQKTVQEGDMSMGFLNKISGPKSWARKLIECSGWHVIGAEHYLSSFHLLEMLDWNVSDLEQHVAATKFYSKWTVLGNWFLRLSYFPSTNILQKIIIMCCSDVQGKIQGRLKHSLRVFKRNRESFQHASGDSHGRKTKIYRIQITEQFTRK